MNNINILDCTLRDGGYINQWNFGYEAIKSICRKSEEAGTEIVEIGFLRDVDYDKNFAVFNSINSMKEILKDKKGDVLHAAMCEALNPLPLCKLEKRNDETVDIIRIIVWKRLLEEGMEYCRGILEKGYQLCVQPNRVDQYSDEDFCHLIEKINQLKPMAFYVVDSFGILDEDKILHYADLAHQYLKPEIALGYHGHNNLMQAYGAAQGLIQREYDRKLILDASVYGIGRGAGNLNIELIAKYLNECLGKSYGLEHYLDIYERYISDIYMRIQWGYSPFYYLTALHRCNPMYGEYCGMEKGLGVKQMSKLLGKLSERDKIIFNRELADKYLLELSYD